MNQNDEIKLYLDTSVPSAFYDTSKPVRQLVTQKWFEYKARGYTLYTSITAVDEIGELNNPDKRQNIMDIIFDYYMNIIELSEEAVILAEEYMKRGAVPKSEREDAYHIAIASVNRFSCLASWNFKHIVSINPIRKIHEISRKHNYAAVEIGSLQIFGGAKYGNV